MVNTEILAGLLVRIDIANLADLGLGMLIAVYGIATANGLSKKWGCAYHGNTAEHRDQREVEGTHD